MKKIFSVLLVIIIAGLSGVSDASAQPLISVVDIQRIMKNSTAAKSAKQQLSSKQSQFQAQLNTREKELKAQNAELLKQRGVLSKEEMQKRISSFQQKASKAQSEVQKKRASLDKAFNQALSDIQKNVTSIIKQIARERNIALVIPSSQTLHYNPAMDISDEVLARLNKKLPSLKLKF